MTDPLPQFRKRTADFPPSDPGDGYVAFAAKDRVERLKIKRANKPTHAPGSVSSLVFRLVCLPVALSWM